ncbi:hypothetical protein I9W82_005643 [Candida metapsilosis]|uniref:Uncharacterized protein n=1 Tax=Candida metapsilosis TaxID=273372 RepID=A0A8H7ZDE3_9ASCO|nr:hypothetical protein I9W82_005643 [Candida metapsilosis]
MNQITDLHFESSTTRYIGYKHLDINVEATYDEEQLMGKIFPDSKLQLNFVLKINNEKIDQKVLELIGRKLETPWKEMDYSSKSNVTDDGVTLTNECLLTKDIKKEKLLTSFSIDISFFYPNDSLQLSSLLKVLNHIYSMLLLDWGFKVPLVFERFCRNDLKLHQQSRAFTASAIEDAEAAYLKQPAKKTENKTPTITPFKEIRIEKELKFKPINELSGYTVSSSREDIHNCLKHVEQFKKDLVSQAPIWDNSMEILRLHEKYIKKNISTYSPKEYVEHCEKQGIKCSRIAF